MPDAKTDRMPDAKTDRMPDAKTDRMPDAETDRMPDAKTDRMPDAETDGRRMPKRTGAGCRNGTDLWARVACDLSPWCRSWRGPGLLANPILPRGASVIYETGPSLKTKLGRAPDRASKPSSGEHRTEPQNQARAASSCVRSSPAIGMRRAACGRRRRLGEVSATSRSGYG
jgi:hypothetical protein